MQLEVNYLAVIVAALASMAVGFAWYSPVLFAKPWMKLMGYSADSLKKAQKAMGPMYALSLAAAVVTAYVLSHSVTLSENFYGYARLMTGLTTGFFMWLGFVAPVQLTDVIFGSKKWKLFAINTGYQLVSLLVMGAILAVWV